MPCSVIVSGAQSGDQLPHMDVSTAPDMLPPLDRHPSSCHISTFVALSPQYQNMLIRDFVAKFARTSREVRANFT